MNQGNKVVVITGGSDGIGKALCIEYGKQGFCVVYSGRNLDKLKQVSLDLDELMIKHLWFQLDASNHEDNQKLVDEAFERFGRIDVVIANAGVSMRVLFQDISLDLFEQLFKVNFLGAVSLIKAALPYLVKTKGTIIGISSVNGRRATPARTAYAASKYALEGFLESLRMELKPQAVHVLVVCPGFTQTNMRSAALMPDGQVQGETKLNEHKMMSPEFVAHKVYTAMKVKKRDLVLTTQGKLAVFFGKFFPSLMDRIVFKVMSKKADSPFYKQK